ncbi:DNA polymerase [Mesorhizobium sp. B1-1-5]|uniref:DNA polymerase n=1 Tax=Mesorhizobium sp. B1-1-5 TaxID=2589979 RepID=UPI00112BA479|nr:DNA polymerase [Mesorhizobium sp. B1-1-5]TPO05171.1 DNA polymerase I [Mesorhizobium sp. B1-1-5]
MVLYEKQDGDAIAAFQEIWLVDFEYNGEPEVPKPVCMVALELKSRRTIRLWRTGLYAASRAPFDVGPNSLFVAYFAPAELSCFLELGWPLPARVIDLFAEHRVETNTFGAKVGNSLLDAMAIRGLGHIEVAEKERLRELILSRQSWSESEQFQILGYCESDVLALAELLPRMMPGLDLDRALLRGRYMAAVAEIVRNGIPVDHRLYRRARDNWMAIKGELIDEVDGFFGVYEGTTFKHDQFARFLTKAGITWPRLPSGACALDDETFSRMADGNPAIRTLHELRRTVARMNGAGLQVSSDGRNRCGLSPFSSVTGRNQPSNSRMIYGPARWMRQLIKPEAGTALAYVDWAAQEIGIAGGLSGDERLIQAYLTGDPYMAFAVEAGLAPHDASPRSHPRIRSVCKAIVLGLGYGMGRDALAASAGITIAHASELLEKHKRIYHRYWRFNSDSVDSAYLSHEVQSTFGWKARVGPGTKPTSLMNFPMQANGAEMMRIAAIAAVELGIRVAAPVHDAFLIESPLEELDDRLAEMRRIMAQAGEAVCGLPIRTDSVVIKAPGRFVDERGADMWDRIIGRLERVKHDG